MELTYIVALGANRDEAALMAFPTVAEAEAFLTSCGLVARPERHTQKAQRWGSPEDEWGVPTGEEMALLLRFYDSGCGEIDILELRTVPVGQPVIGWDRD